MKSKITIAKEALRVVNPLAFMLWDVMEKSANSVDSASSASVDELTAEVKKQSIKMRFALQQAKISQELAIAHRITNAIEVEIEEFYDNGRKGHLGLDSDSGGGLNIGIGAESKQVSRRVYRFKGGEATDDKIVNQILDDELDDIE